MDNGDLLAIFRVVDLLGLFLNGIIGGTIARRKHFDMVGFVVLALLSAMGGGVLRDLMLAAGRPVAVTDPSYLVTASLGAFVAVIVNLQGRWWRVFYVAADCVVLGAWAATGTVKALTLGVHPLPAVVLGMSTAIGGGMIRDVAAGEVPSVFGGNTLYAVPALVSGLTVLVGSALALPGAWLLVLATLSGASLALMSSRYEWRLPRPGDGALAQARAAVASRARLRRAQERVRANKDAERTARSQRAQRDRD